MLGKVRELTLDFLNQATQAWVQIEYNRRFHREIGCSPRHVSPLRRTYCGPALPPTRCEPRFAGT
jgi:hypothetical protein